MKKIIKNYGIYILIIIIFIVLSGVLKFKQYSTDKEVDARRQEVLKDKEIVTVWLKEDYDTETRKFQIREYNNYNTDNVYIAMQVHKDDYINLLKTAVANNNQVDIFQYGSYELFRFNRLMSMTELGINIDKVGKDKFLYYEKEPMGVKVAGNNVKFVYNKEMLEGAGLDPNTQPKTWKEVIEYAEKIKKAYPEIVPFEFPAYYLEELRISIGEMSVNKGSIYTTFWDYKNGEFNFDYAEDILNIYKEMYSKGLIYEDFEQKTKIHVREDFASGKTAMILSTFEDKNFFEGIRPLKFDIGISNIPKIDINDTENYFYTGTYKALMVNKNIEIEDEENIDKEELEKMKRHKEAVKKAYEWFLSEDVNKEILASKKAFPLILKDKTVKNDIYEEYNNDENFTNEIYDPTIHIQYSWKLTMDLFYKAIKGEVDIKEAITTLNNQHKADCDQMVKLLNFDFNKYVEN